MIPMLQEDFKMAERGREIWLSIKEKHQLNNECYLIICPSSDGALNKEALNLLPDFLQRKYIDKAVIVALDIQLQKELSKGTYVSISLEVLRYEDIEALLKYYRLVQFIKNIAVISLEDPFGNAGIIGKGDITLTDYIRDSIYV